MQGGLVLKAPNFSRYRILRGRFSGACIWHNT
jgi:hypothetical protein